MREAYLHRATSSLEFLFVEWSKVSLGRTGISNRDQICSETEFAI